MVLSPVVFGCLCFYSPYAMRNGEEERGQQKFFTSCKKKKNVTRPKKGAASSQCFDFLVPTPKHSATTVNILGARTGTTKQGFMMPGFSDADIHMEHSTQ